MFLNLLISCAIFEILFQAIILLKNVPVFRVIPCVNVSAKTDYNQRVVMYRNMLNKTRVYFDGNMYFPHDNSFMADVHKTHSTHDEKNNHQYDLVND